MDVVRYKQATGTDPLCGRRVAECDNLRGWQHLKGGLVLILVSRQSWTGVDLLQGSLADHPAPQDVSPRSRLFYLTEHLAIGIQ